MTPKTVRAITKIQQELAIVWITFKVVILMFAVFLAIQFLFATFISYMILGISLGFAAYVGLKYMNVCIDKIELTIIIEDD